MLFDIAAPPESKFLYQPPKYTQPRNWFDKMALEFGGFKYNKKTNSFSGEKSGYGKALGWTGITGLGSDAVFKALSKAQKADDSVANAELATERDLGKLETIAGVGLTVAGAASGNAGLISSGIKLGTAGIGQVASTPQDALKEQTASDRGTQYWFKKGGKMKSPSEDIAMIDKKTGKKIGEVSYNERIIGIKDDKIMQKLAYAHKYPELGKYFAKVIKKHDANESMQEESSEGEMKGGGMPKAPVYEKGGELTADKAKLILADGTIRGKKITPRQKRYFGYIAGGGDPQHWKGGKIKMYKAGGLVTPPSIDSEEYQKWLAEHGDLLKSSSKDLFDQFLADWQSTNGQSDPGFSLAPNAKDTPPSTNALSPLGFTGTPSSDSTAKLSANDWGNIASAGATGLFDIAKFITGLHGAGKSLPTWRMPEDWVNYLHKTRDMADQGFTAPETANASNERFRNYSMDKANIENYSGGSNAFALGNEGAAINRLNAASGDFAAKDAALHRSNLSTFGDAAYKTIPFDRTLFEDKYNLAFLNKKTAAELGQQGLQGLFDTAQDFQYTAPGSLYDQMVKQQLAYYKNLNSIDWKKAVSTIGI